MSHIAVPVVFLVASQLILALFSFPSGATDHVTSTMHAGRTVGVSKGETRSQSKDKLGRVSKDTLGRVVFRCTGRLSNSKLIEGKCDLRISVFMQANTIPGSEGTWVLSKDSTQQPSHHEDCEERFTGRGISCAEVSVFFGVILYDFFVYLFVSAAHIVLSPG